eukprot:33277_1
MLQFIYFVICCLSIKYALPITKSDLHQLQQIIIGEIEFPDEHVECLLSDKMIFTTYTCPYQNSFAIILPENSNDISSIIQFITQFDTDFRIKSSGSCLGGYSKCDGCLNINLERMTNIEYKYGIILNQEFDSKLIPDNVYVMIESGVTMKKLVKSFSNNTLGISNRRIPHSDSSGVTAGGFYQSGGWTETIRYHGYASDWVIGIEIILYDGTIKTIFDIDIHHDISDSDSLSSEDDDCNYTKDLLWAVRGSGAGSYGIISKYYLKTVEIEKSESILHFNIKYNLLSIQNGIEIMKACTAFTQKTNNKYKIGCGIWPASDATFGYNFRFEGKYFGDDINDANESIYSILLNPLLIQYAYNIDIHYPPNEYSVNTFIYAGTAERPGIINTRLINNFNDLTDEFYEAFIGFFMKFLMDGTKCICGLTDSKCEECNPGINDYLTCCGVGARALFFLYGDSVYNSDPKNCYTSAPNRNYIGRVAIIVGTFDKTLFNDLKDTILMPLMYEAIDRIWPYLGTQNFIGYRDNIDITLNSYFGGKKKKKKGR